jgi:ABC-type nitrate/sulfonate/bicarbonate transport system substrate-binding protein
LKLPGFKNIQDIDKMPVDNSLHKAAHKGDLEECRKYLDGAPDEDIEAIDINEPGAAERRALHRSAGAGHFDVCQLLLERGAIIDLQDKNGRTALHWAAISGHTEVVKLLLEKNNLKVQEFRLVNLPGTIQMYTEKAPAQFLTGINILYAREPFLSLLLAQGDWRTFIDEPLFAKNILSPWPMTMTLFSTKFLKEKPLLAKKVIDAYDKAMLFIKEHPQEASYIFSKYLEERYGVKLNLRKVNHLRYSQVSKELIQRQSDWYFDNKLIPSKIKATDLFFDESMLGP